MVALGLAFLLGGLAVAHAELFFQRGDLRADAGETLIVALIVLAEVRGEPVELGGLVGVVELLLLAVSEEDTEVVVGGVQGDAHPAELDGDDIELGLEGGDALVERARFAPALGHGPLLAHVTASPG